MQSRSEPAIKFTYNPHSETWQSHKCRVFVDPKPFAEGGMRLCLKLFELEDNGNFMPCVAKVFKKEKDKKAYFDEALTQMAAECFAQEFNRIMQPTRYRVSFLPVSVIMLSERKAQLCNVEPQMQGRYVKHNDNDGHVETSEMLPQAFSHFSWEASDHSLVVCDIQGVSDCYTDPQIHSLDEMSFGAGNMGADGIVKFLASHRCNQICRAMKLPAMSRPAGERQIAQKMAQLRDRGLREVQQRQQQLLSMETEYGIRSPSGSPLAAVGGRRGGGEGDAGDQSRARRGSSGMVEGALPMRCPGTRSRLTFADPNERSPRVATGAGMSPDQADQIAAVKARLHELQLRAYMGAQ
mmetsp:Transcript_16798/g.40491  ORF Transcript_16798/g.40491 Transcript_16798/m.40491 type:complete len:352 (+) Transcript_16798:203-1258(+)